MNFIPAGITSESPALAARASSTREPIDQHEVAGSTHFEGLDLFVGRISEALDWIGGKNRQGTVLNLRAKLVGTRGSLGIAINLGRGLAAQKTAGVTRDVDIQACAITRNHSTAKIACVGPNALAVATRREQTNWISGDATHHRTASSHRGDGQFRASLSHTVKCSRTMVSFRFEIGPSTTIAPRSMM